MRFLNLAKICCTLLAVGTGFAHGEDYRVQLADFELPEPLLKRELRSGLPNTIQYLFVLRKEKSVIDKKIVQLAITYDLWDEVYRVTVSGNLREQKILGSMQDILKYIEKQSVVFELRGVQSSLSQQRIEGRVVFNPINDAKIKKIQDWISRNNNSYTVGKGLSGESVALRTRGPRFQSLFDNILEQYLESEKQAGLWQSKKHVYHPVTHENKQD